LVADSLKFGRRAMIRVGHVSELDAIVTDSELDSHYQSLFESEGVECIVADNKAKTA